ncbi:MAG: conjugal transfer protein [Filifactoraceae bacterium]
MNKKEKIAKIALFGVGVVTIVDRIRFHHEMRKLKEKVIDIGSCHNEFCLQQGKWNLQTDYQLSDIIDEIGAVYEHMEELSKVKEDGR